MAGVGEAAQKSWWTKQRVADEEILRRGMQLVAALYTAVSDK